MYHSVVVHNGEKGLQWLMYQFAIVQILAILRFF